jgi:hypothetical protein
LKGLIAWGASWGLKRRGARNGQEGRVRSWGTSWPCVQMHPWREPVVLSIACLC